MPLASPKIRGQSFQEVNLGAIPPSGASPETIWHMAYDTQTYTSAATVSLDFFTAVNVDKTLSNMDAAGQFPAPQTFQLYNFCCDAWPAATPVSTAASNVGSANDLALLLQVGRASWLFTLQNKTYGRYKLTTLHGTGGPVVFFASAIATPGTIQYAKNDPSDGWNYNGGITIPAQTSFQFNIIFQAAQTLTQNWLIMIGLFGVQQRAVK